MAQKLGMNDSGTKIKEAIILAGGLGTRIRSLFPDIPKCMVPVAGRPFLDYLLLKLKSQGFSKIILSVGFKKEYIQSYYGKKFDELTISYSEEVEPLGTGGAIKQSLQNCNQECCLVLNGDSYLDFNIKEFFLRINFTRLNILTVMVGDRSRYGAFLIDDISGEISFEKGVPGPGYINAGVYILNHDLFNDIDEPSFSFEHKILAKGINNQNCNLIYSNSEFIDIGMPEDFQRADSFIKSLGQISFE